MAETSSTREISAPFLRLVDTLSQFFANVSILILGLLVCVIFFEMIARYFFSGSTTWGTEVAFMLNGAIFLLALAYTMKLDRHVRIDILSAQFPERIRVAIEVVLYVILLVPALMIMTYGAFSQSIRYFVTEERSLSAWAPLLWPFSSVIAVGLVLLWLQTLAELLRCIARLTHRRER